MALTSNLSKNVFDVLKKDAEYCMQGVTDDLFTTKDVTLNSKSWDYSLPTLTNNAVARRSKDKWVNNNIGKRFFDEYPIFKDFDFSNILVAGGAVSHFIRRDYHFLNDIDLFVFGLDEKEATRRVNNMIRFLINTHVAKLEDPSYCQKECSPSFIVNRQIICDPKAAKEKGAELEQRIKLYNNMYINGLIDVYNTGRCITLVLRKNWREDPIQIQIILRLYNTKSEILHGFDLGSSAVGFDGKELYFTTLSKFSYEYRVNIVDTSRRSVTYEQRLLKYLDRGFEIIMPKFHMSKIKIENNSFVVNLPFLKIGGIEKNGKKIHIPKHIPYGDKSDYAFNVTSYTVPFINVRKLVKDDYTLVTFKSGQDGDIINEKPLLSNELIDKVYDQIKKSIYKEGKFDMKQLKNYVSIVPSELVCKRVLLDKEEKYIDPKEVHLIKQKCGNSILNLQNEIVDFLDYFSKLYLLDEE